VILALGACLSGCAGGATSPPPVGMALPTLPVWPLPSNSTCGGVGTTSLILMGTEADGVYAQTATGAKVPVLWPPGYTAVFSTGLEIRDPEGRVVARGGLDLEKSGPTGLTPCFGRDASGAFGVSMLPL
jgi:hypothetical protein